MRLSPSIAILRTQSDERLAALARGGSQNAFEAIAERYRRQLIGACRRALSESRAEDAVQQAFMSAWVALSRGDEVVNLRAWLLMIARNTALNALRAPGYDFSELRDSLVADAVPQDELERREVMRQTLAGLAALPERQREALLRSAVEGVAYADIARDMGLSEGATRQLVLRARTAMRSAATALVPWPLAQWFALSGRTDATLRVAEIATASGGAGATALLAKAGVVAVVAGSVAVGPAVLRHDRVAPSRASAPLSRAAPASAPVRAPALVSTAQPIVATTAAARSRNGAAGGSSRADERDRSHGPDDESRESSDARGGDGERDDDDRSRSNSGGAGHSGSSGSAGGLGGGDHEVDDDGGYDGSPQPAINAIGTSGDADGPVHPDSSGPGSDHELDRSGSGSGADSSSDPEVLKPIAVDE